MFLNVDSEESVKVMKRHLRANNVSISYDLDGDPELCEPRAIMYHATIHHSSLGGIRKEFLIPIGLCLRAASANEERMDDDLSGSIEGGIEAPIE